MIETSLINLGPWLLVCAGYAALWFQTHSILPTSILVAGGYIWGAFEGIITPYALIPLLLLTISATLIRRHDDWRYKLGHMLFIGIAVGLALHHVPGFNNIQTIPPAPMTPDAVPFSLWLNLDKPLVGLWLLLFTLHAGRAFVICKT